MKTVFQFLPSQYMLQVNLKLTLKSNVWQNPNSVEILPPDERLKNRVEPNAIVPCRDVIERVTLHPKPWRNSLNINPPHEFAFTRCRMTFNCYSHAPLEAKFATKMDVTTLLFSNFIIFCTRTLWDTLHGWNVLLKKPHKASNRCSSFSNITHIISVTSDWQLQQDNRRSFELQSLMLGSWQKCELINYASRFRSSGRIQHQAEYLGHVS